MKAIISRTTLTYPHEFPEVGTSDRMVVSTFRTERGVLACARAYAGGRSFRVEFFHAGRFYGEPYKILFSR